jgi:DNA-binding transcriptional regulator LsrR (DeoR family)
MAPGLLASADMRRGITAEPNIASVIQAYDELTTALVGVGSLEPSPLLRESGNAVSPAEQDELRSRGAVGDICMRFFDAEGQPIASDLDGRVLGISAAALNAIPRRVGVAGGQRKWGAIRAALVGGWLNVLVTDLHTAKWLAAGNPEETAGETGR